MNTGKSYNQQKRDRRIEAHKIRAARYLTPAQKTRRIAEVKDQIRVLGQRQYWLIENQIRPEEFGKNDLRLIDLYEEKDALI